MALELVELGLAFLLGCSLAEYFKFRAKAAKGFQWLAVAGVWFLFAGTFSIATTLGSYIGVSAWTGIETIFEVIGWIFALIGTLFVAYEILVEK